MVNVALDLKTRSLCRALVADPAGVCRRRAGAVATFRTVFRRLGSFRRTWSAKIGHDSPASGLNLPLLHMLVSHFGYVDAKIAHDLANGMPIGGEVSASGPLVARESPASLSIPEWKLGIQERNADAVGRVGEFRATTVGAD